MVGARFLHPFRPHDEQASPGVDAEQMMKPLDALPVAPLYVVQQQEQRWTTWRKTRDKVSKKCC
jgi:hypothetical protein